MWSLRHQKKFNKQDLYKYTPTPYPSRSFFFRYYTPIRLKKRINYHGRMYTRILRFCFELQPVFFFKLRSQTNLENKKRLLSPQLLYIEPENRVSYTYEIFHYFLWYWNRHNRHQCTLFLTPTLITLFYRYYHKVFKRLVLFYLVKD